MTALVDYDNVRLGRRGLRYLAARLLDSVGASAIPAADDADVYAGRRRLAGGHMDFEAFKRIVTAFSDDPEDLDLKRGTLLVQVRDEVVEATLSQSPTGVTVTENGDRLTAES